MWLSLATLFVAMLSTVTAHPSRQNVLCSKIYRRDEDVSALELKSPQIPSLRKTYWNSFAAVPIYSNLDREDPTSDLQLAPTGDGSEKDLLVALGVDDEPCPDGSVRREGNQFCPGETKLLIPNPSEQDDPQHGLKPEPDDSSKPLPDQPAKPKFPPWVVPSEPLLQPAGSSLLELLPSENHGLPGAERCTRPETSRHVCCEGPSGGIQGIAPNTFYQTVENCNLCKLFCPPKKKINKSYVRIVSHPLSFHFHLMLSF